MSHNSRTTSARSRSETESLKDLAEVGREGETGGETEGCRRGTYILLNRRLTNPRGLFLCVERGGTKPRQTIGLVKNFILKIGGHLAAGGLPASSRTCYVN